MNPIGWRREHQVALCIAAAAGTLLGLTVGYLTSIHRYHGIQWYLERWDYDGAHWAAGIGLILGIAFVYAHVLLRTPR